MKRERRKTSVTDEGGRVDEVCEGNWEYWSQKMFTGEDTCMRHCMTETES